MHAIQEYHIHLRPFRRQNIFLHSLIARHDRIYTVVCPEKIKSPQLGVFSTDGESENWQPLDDAQENGAECKDLSLWTNVRRWEGVFGKLSVDRLLHKNYKYFKKCLSMFWANSWKNTSVLLKVFVDQIIQDFSSQVWLADGYYPSTNEIGGGGVESEVDTQASSLLCEFICSKCVAIDTTKNLSKKPYIWQPLI